MKTWITSQHVISCTKWNNKTQIVRVNDLATRNFGLSFSYNFKKFISFFDQLICKILCVLDVKWTIWFVRPDFVFDNGSERLKQKNFILISWKFVCDFFMFGKKQNRIRNFIKSQFFTCNFQPIHPVVEKTWWCIWFKFKIIISLDHIFKKSSIVQSMNAFNIRISPKNKRSWCDHFHFLLFCFFRDCTRHCNHTSQSTVNSYHQRFGFWIDNHFDSFFLFVKSFLHFRRDDTFTQFSIFENTFFLIFHVCEFTK